MADVIKQLPDFVSNQIAAGEVVNRPSSVVKELVENAVDAGGTNITVNFKNGGKDLIQVVDNGCGMSVIDARLAFDKHATSKISSVDDIYSLSSLGFRGEALASIASIAEVELKSRRDDSEVGTQVEINGGKFVNQSVISCAVGSQFSITNLFYNVPARKRFLDKSTKEAGYIHTEFNRVALCHPEIEFSLYDNDALVLKLPIGTLKQRIVGVVGKTMTTKLLEVDARTTLGSVKGYIGRPSSAKKSNRDQYLFVNGRYFKSPYFHKAILTAYEKLIAPTYQPSYFIYIDIEPDKIDVNVHPQKIEVKFDDGAALWQIISAAVRESIAKSGQAPQMDFDMDTSLDIPVLKVRDDKVLREPIIKSNPEFNPFDCYSGASVPRSISESGKGMLRSQFEGKFYNDEFEEVDQDEYFDSSTDRAIESYNEATHSAFEDDTNDDANGGVNEGASDVVSYESSLMEFIDGEEDTQIKVEFKEQPKTEIKDILSIGKRYIATVIDGNLSLIDTCRAYETILYYRYLKIVGSGSSVTQQLLFPECMVLSADDYQLMKQCISDFNTIGFDISFKDEYTIDIGGVPAEFSEIPTQELLYDLLDGMRDDVTSVDDVRREHLANVISKVGSAAYRRGGVRKCDLTQLIEELMITPNPSFTQSGLPIMTTLSPEEIGAKFNK